MTLQDVFRFVATLLAIGLFYRFFYTGVVASWGPLVRPLLSPLRRLGRYPARDIDAVGKLAAATVAQTLFALALLFVLGIGAQQIVGPIKLGPLALGLGLGIAELGFSAFACTLVIQTALAVSGDSEHDWFEPSHGGWMGQFLAAARTAPPWLFASCVVIYVGGEEVVFRAVLMELLRPVGPVVAISLSVACFIAVQAANMPSATSALRPMVGALVVGTIHGVLFWQWPNILPLIVAHAAFFVGAVGSSRLRLRSP